MNEQENEKMDIEATPTEETAQQNADIGKNFRTSPRPLRARRTIAPPIQPAVPTDPAPVLDATETTAAAEMPTETTPAEKQENFSPEEIENISGSEPVEANEKKNVNAISVFDWIKSILLSFAAVIFIFTILFRGSTVVGGSMQNTLHNGERVIISDFMYTPKTGDIVVLRSPSYKDGEEFLIKRIIALGGQTVKINFKTWQIWVDGVLLDEPYVVKDNSDMLNESLMPDKNGEVEFTVKENRVFVMGDNRNDSLDSRSEQIGEIDRQYILGRVILRYLPFSAFGPVE